MKVAPCNSYCSRTVAHQLATLPGKSVFKVYFVSIVGRADPARYEWDEAGAGIARFLAAFSRCDVEGVGFVTAFPHLTKVFRFAPSAEIVLHVRAFATPDLAPLGLGRDDGYLEFACYAEAAIAADEYHAWAGAASVEQYLGAWSRFVDGPVRNHRKLWDYQSSHN